LNVSVTLDLMEGDQRRHQVPASTNGEALPAEKTKKRRHRAAFGSVTSPEVTEVEALGGALMTGDSGDGAGGVQVASGIVVSSYDDSSSAGSDSFVIMVD